MILDIYILVISIFLQGYSVINTEGFGIPILVLIIIYLFLKNKLFIKGFEKKFIIFNIIILICMFIGFVLNKGNLDFFKVMRIEMILIIAYCFYQYINFLIRVNKFKNFICALRNISILISLYGIYQFIAYKLGLPMFLNIFRNNPSYGLSINIYDYYGGGWTNNRVYATFTEPSFYGVFLVVLIVMFYFINVKGKNILMFMLLVNLYLTFSRSAWIAFIYIILFYIIIKIFYKIKSIKRIILAIAMLMPIINIMIVKYANNKIFNDFSSQARTNSVLFYLNGVFDSIKTFLFGHGLGSMQNNYNINSYINYMLEQNAHNGYIEILYEFGVVTFIILLIFIYLFVKKINTKDSYIIYLVVSMTSLLGTSFYVESTLILIILFIVVIKNRSSENNITS